MCNWRDIEGWEGYYQVSDTGKVKQLMNTHFRKAGLIRQQTIRNGYRQVQLVGRVFKLTHRLVAKAFIPNPDGFNAVRHKDGNNGNNRVENLEWVPGWKLGNYSKRFKTIVS